jgi:hypothetical protein
MSGGRDIRLMASSGVSLEEHVGHQIEVRGKMSGGGAASTGPSSASTSPPREGGAAAPDEHKGSGRALTVSAVRMIATSCATGSN